MSRLPTPAECAEVLTGIAADLHQRATAAARAAQYSDDTRTYQVETHEATTLEADATMLRTAATVLTRLAAGGRT